MRQRRFTRVGQELRPSFAKPRWAASLSSSDAFGSFTTLRSAARLVAFLRTFAMRRSSRRVWESFGMAVLGLESRGIYREAVGAATARPASAPEGAGPGCAARVGAASGGEHDLAPGLPAAEVRERLRRVLERVGPEHDRPDAALLGQVEERPEDLGNRLRLVLRVGAPVEPGDLDVLEQDAVGGHARDGAAREADHDEAAVPRDALERALEDVAADRVVDHV